MLNRLILVLEIFSILIFVFVTILTIVNALDTSEWHVGHFIFIFLSIVPFVLIILTKYIIYGKLFLLKDKGGNMEINMVDGKEQK